MSTPGRPPLYPWSPMVTPGIGLPSSSRMGTRTQCTPWDSAGSWLASVALPGVCSCANTAAMRPWRAALPMYVFCAEGLGEWTMNSSVSGSYVAVVSRFCTSDPWPRSVMAKQPSRSRLMICGTRCVWRSLPSASTAPPNSPHCTPDFTMTPRSAWPTISMPVSVAPISPVPPWAALKTPLGMPVSRRRSRRARIASRASSRGRPTWGRKNSSSSVARTRSRSSAYLPSRSFCRAFATAGSGVVGSFAGPLPTVSGLSFLSRPEPEPEFEPSGSVPSGAAAAATLSMSSARSVFFMATSSPCCGDRMASSVESMTPRYRRL